MPERPMTMSDVARRAGVHPATVSRALRDDPRITPAQRAKVRRAAQELGYRTNPLVAALMTTRRTGRPPVFRATLGYITKYPPERATWFTRAFGDILPGALKRARLHGYGIEEFNLADSALTPRRTAEILRTRGILGVIIAPLHSVRESPQLDWTQFSTVAIGHSLSEVPVTRVTHNHFQAMKLAARQCRAAGCQRLGLVMQRRVHEKVGKLWAAALLLEQSEQPSGRRVPPLILDDLDEAAFRAWFCRHRPDAVLSHDFEPINTWLKRLGCEIPRDVAFVTLDRRTRDDDVAGVDQDFAGIGAAAVDLLIALLNRNDRGLPDRPATVLLDGTWVRGATLRAKL
jgi:LacI family transcriptional regulator